MRDTIARSYGLLNDSERPVFRRLAVSVGGMSLDAAESVCAGDLSSSVLDNVSSLVDKHLFVAEEDEHGTRLRMLEVIREYALGRVTMESGGSSLKRVGWAGTAGF